MPEGNEPNTQETTVEEGATAPITLKLKVKGREETRQFTQEELTATVQKAMYAEQQMQGAAEALKLVDDMQAMKAGDVGAFRRVAKKLGYTDEQFAQFMDAQQGAQTPAGKGTQTPQNAGGEGGDDVQSLIEEITQAVAAKLAPQMNPKRGPVGLEDLDPRVAKAIRFTVGDKVDGLVKKIIDEDKVLGEYVIKSTDKQRAAIHKLVRERVQRRVSSGEDLWDPETVNAAIQETRQHLDEIGFRPQGEKSQNPAPFLGLGPAGKDAASSSFHPDKPVKRPEGGLNSPDADAYILDRLQRAAMQIDSEG